MAISSTTNRVNYTGNGVTTAFSFPYAFQAQADLVVISTVIATGVQTTKTLTTDYTISGTTDAQGFYPSGGTVTMLVAPASTVRLTIYRDPAATQTVDLVENDPLPAEVLESAYDKAVMLIQRLKDVVGRSLRQPEGDSADIAVLPAKVTRAGKLLQFNSTSGDPEAVAAADLDLSTVTAFAATLLDDADAAAARATLGVPFSPPQGRLTLTSATPVLTSDVTAGTSIYYTPYIGQYVPLYDGSAWAATTFTELTLALSSDSGHTGYHQSGKNFDLFVINDSGTLRLATGPAWTSDTARADALTRLNGLLVNNASIVLRFGSASGNTVTVAANRATYVGTMRASANGQCAMIMNPAAAAGGGDAKLFLWNAYNRVIHSATSKESANSWSYTTTTWRSANNSTANRISIVNGADEDAADAVFNGLTSTSSAAGFVAIGLDSTSAISGSPGAAPIDANSISVAAFLAGRIGLGFHYLQALEFGNTGATFYGDNNSPTTVQMALMAEYPM